MHFSFLSWRNINLCYTLLLLGIYFYFWHVSLHMDRYILYHICPITSLKLIWTIHGDIILQPNTFCTNRIEGWFPFWLENVYLIVRIRYYIYLVVPRQVYTMSTYKMKQCLYKFPNWFLNSPCIFSRIKTCGWSNLWDDD